MGIIFLGSAITGAIALALLLAAHWASDRQPAIRNIASFLIAVVASYAAGFTLDMALSAADGELPPANIVLPSITWSSIAIVSAVAAFSARGSRVACTLPFWLNMLVALFAGFVHVRNFAIAGLLLLIGMLLWRHRSRKSSNGIEDINSPEIQMAMRRLQVVHVWTMWARPVSVVGAVVTSVWLVYLAYLASGAMAAFGWLVGLSVVYRLGVSPMFAVASSVLCFHFHVVGSWLPIASYLLGALLLYVDAGVHDLMRQRVDPFHLGSTGDV